jgi:uncharacterized protein DUF3310
MRAAEELRRCRALRADGLQCEGQATDLTTHIGDHWAETNGMTTYWTDAVAIKCTCPPGGHTLTGTCLPDVPAPASERQVGGNHYRKFKIQPWDVIDEYGLGFYAGNALKYLLRRKTNRLEDLKKARHYLDKLIELEEAGSGEG